MATSSLTAALYLRCSTDEQTESIAAQQMLLERYAADHNLQIVATYQDRGKSGDSFQQRAGLQQMLAAAKAGQFQQVLVRNLSRLSRRNSLKTAAQIITPLLDAGVGVCTASQGDLKLDTATGRIVLTVLSEMENTENSTRAFNVMNGMLQTAANGYWCSGSVPQGYRLIGPKRAKELELGDPEEIATVRRIFQLYTAGHSIRAIVRQLNNEGSRSWGATAVTGILRNPVYCGDHVFNRTSRGKYYQVKDGTLTARQQHWQQDGETARRSRNADSDLIVRRDRWPAIVSRQIWDKTQQLLERNKAHTAPNRDYVFSSLLQCHCGTKMHGYTRKQGNKRYLCSSCGATAGEAELLEHVTASIQRQYSPEQIGELRAAIERKLAGAARHQQNGTATKPLQAKLAKYERRLLEVDSDMLPVVQAEIRRLRQQLAEAERSQQAAAASSRDIGKRIEQALADFYRLPQAIRQKPAAEVRRYFQQALDRIEVLTSAKQGACKKNYRLAGLDIYGAVPVLSLPVYRSVQDLLLASWRRSA